MPKSSSTTISTTPQKATVSTAARLKEERKPDANEPEAKKAATDSNVKRSPLGEPKKSSGLLPNPPGPRPQHRPMHPPGFLPRFPPGHPRFRPPRGLLDFDGVENFPSPPEGPQGRGVPRMFDPRGPRGPPRPLPPRGFMGPPDANSPQPLLNFRGPAEPFDVRGPRPHGNFRGELRPERPRFPPGDRPPNAPFPARGPRPREERPPFPGDLQMRGRNPDLRFQRPTGPGVPGPPDFYERENAGHESEKRDERPPPRMAPSKQPPPRDNGIRGPLQEHHHSPEHHRLPERSSDDQFIEERPMWANRSRPEHDFRRDMTKRDLPEPQPDNERRQRKNFWGEDGGRERDIDRSDFERGRRDIPPQEQRPQDPGDFRRSNPPDHFRDERDHQRPVELFLLILKIFSYSLICGQLLYCNMLC